MDILPSLYTGNGYWPKSDDFNDGVGPGWVTTVLKATYARSIAFDIYKNGGRLIEKKGLFSGTYYVRG